MPPLIKSLPNKIDKAEQAIIAVLAYYDLLERPLTIIELFKSLPPLGGLSFFEFTQILASSANIKKICRLENGLYFLIDRDNLLKIREKRTKIAQIKWRLLKKKVKFLRLAPFLKLAAVSGSLANCNTKQGSDFDLLIITARNRLWTTRACTTLLTEILGIRRHGTRIKNRLCLNCYIDERNLNVEAEARPYQFESVQEYSRLTPVVETIGDSYQNFLTQNEWLKNQLHYFPWPNDKTCKKIRPSFFYSIARKIIELPFSGVLGDRAEIKLGRWQMRRINKKIKQEPRDNCFVDKNCLKFHPRLKSLKLMREFNQKIGEMNKLCGGPTCGKLP